MVCQRDVAISVVVQLGILQLSLSQGLETQVDSPEGTDCSEWQFPMLTPGKLHTNTHVTHNAPEA